MTRVFISYAHQDESFRVELEKQLSGLRRNGYIDTWTDHKIVAGEEWDQSIADALDQARIILLLMSSDFLASDYCYESELKRALKRHDANESVVIPIILRDCDWEQTPFARLQALPIGGKPIIDWELADDAYQNVANGIKTSIRRLNGEEGENGLEKPINPAEELLASLRRRAQQATDARDFRILHYDVKQFKLEHPKGYDIEDIERIVKNGLAFETQTTASTHRKSNLRRAPSPSGKTRILPIVLFLLALLGLLAWWFFFRM